MSVRSYRVHYLIEGEVHTIQGDAFSSHVQRGSSKEERNLKLSVPPLTYIPWERIVMVEEVGRAAHS
jgi:hypothetical protein